MYHSFSVCFELQSSNVIYSFDVHIVSRRAIDVFSAWYFGESNIMKCNFKRLIYIEHAWRVAPCRNVGGAQFNEASKL